MSGSLGFELDKKIYLTGFRLPILDVDGTWQEEQLERVEVEAGPIFKKLTSSAVNQLPSLQGIKHMECLPNNYVNSKLWIIVGSCNIDIRCAEMSGSSSFKNDKKIGLTGLRRFNKEFNTCSVWPKMSGSLTGLKQKPVQFLRSWLHQLSTGFLLNTSKKLQRVKYDSFWLI